MREPSIVAGFYRVGDQLGRGGLGDVFAAEDVRTGRPVALKIARAGAEADLRAELQAQACRAIRSDHVVQVLDLVLDDALGLILVFEQLAGETLLERLKRAGPLPFDALSPIVEGLLVGLADTHRAGIVHRNVKPSNVFLEGSPPRVKLVDFCLAKTPAGDRVKPMWGESLGLFSFIPPEQIGTRRTVDGRADLYACATVAYLGMSGKLPYPARNILVMVEDKTKRAARTLGEALGRSVDRALEDWFARALARDPRDRFEDATAALHAWRRLPVEAA
jgi:serine/threonine-protein kinase